MYNVLTLNKIAAVGTKRLGDNYTCGDSVADPDAILVRSASMHEMAFGDNLLAIARAGAGTNNIPKDVCAEQGICVFNTPGANANAVKELVLTGLLLASRKVVEGIEWAKTLKGTGDEMGKKVEKGKSQFVGPEITGKTLGVVGLGAIGILVANVAVAVGMDVIGYDPFLSEANKAKLDPAVKIMNSNEEVMVNCDYLSIHVPLLPDTKDMVDADMIAKMRDGVRILNYSRMSPTSATTRSSARRTLSSFRTSALLPPSRRTTARSWLATRSRIISKTATSSTPSTIPASPFPETAAESPSSARLTRTSRRLPSRA